MMFRLPEAMVQTHLLHPHRLFPTEPGVRALAIELYEQVRDHPIISPHGHTDPAWFALNEPFPDPAQLLVVPDHYLFRMLYGQGVDLARLGIPRIDGGPVETDPRAIWRLFAAHWTCFRGTPSSIWINHVLQEVFGVQQVLSAETADAIYDQIADQLAKPAFRPRALLDRFKIRLLATTESPLDELTHHDRLMAEGYGDRIITTYRPDVVTDPDQPNFLTNLIQFSEITGCDAFDWDEYLEAHRQRRQDFIRRGATATDHGHPSAQTADLDRPTCERLWRKACSGQLEAHEAELLRGQLLLEMLNMSVDDGLVMQIHPGASRNHNPWLMARHGRDKGADIPMATDYVDALRPLLERHGNNPNLTVILFTLDETTYARELAPLAGHYPALRLGPAWWFHDSPQGMIRYREHITETAGFYNTCGFNDDTRAFLSIPARHDVARRIDARMLAQWVAEHRLSLSDAADLMQELTTGLVWKAYRFRGDPALQ